MREIRLALKRENSLRVRDDALDDSKLCGLCHGPLSDRRLSG
jgi:hypothetical protein